VAARAVRQRSVQEPHISADAERSTGATEVAGAGREPQASEPFDRWHDDDGDVLWWRFPIEEPPYVGSPLASDWPFTESDHPSLGWTRLALPAPPGVAKP
jgi:hypothetical protein